MPLDRVHAIRPGDRISVGDRTLRAVAPPLFDNPMSTGLLDEATGAFFSVDSFGALLPEPTQDAADVPAEALAGGMRAWAAVDSPWTNMVDRGRYGQVLDGVRSLQPTSIFSSHLPRPAARRWSPSSRCWGRCPTPSPSWPRTTSSSTTWWPP